MRLPEAAPVMGAAFFVEWDADLSGLGTLCTPSFTLTVQYFDIVQSLCAHELCSILGCDTGGLDMIRHRWQQAGPSEV